MCAKRRSEVTFTEENRSYLAALVVREMEETCIDLGIQGSMAGTIDRDQSHLPWGNHLECGTDANDRETQALLESKRSVKMKALLRARQIITNPGFTGECTCSCGCRRPVGMERMAATIDQTNFARCPECAVRCAR